MIDDDTLPDMTTVRGRLEAYFETGTEGVYWSLVDPGRPGYDGLWTLRNGDQLRIIDTTDETLWSGEIQFEYTTNWQPYPMNPEHGQQAVQGFWVHGLQEDFDPDRWATLFLQSYRAELEPGSAQNQPIEHPFEGKSISMELRLRTLSKERRDELFRYALYPWLYFFSGGDYYSYAKDWGFSLDETLRLIGSPTAQQLHHWQHEPHQYHDTLMPFDWSLFTRIALLFGVYAGLKWKFHAADDAARWLVETGYKDRLLQDVDGIMQVRDILLDQ